MLQTNLIPHGHADLVTHVTYDFYGERLATCSADQRIKIFKRSGEGSWNLETEWKAHDAPVLRLSFAHPLHGSLLASCSHDRSVRIWEEPSAGAASSFGGNGAAGAGAGAGVGAGAGASAFTSIGGASGPGQGHSRDGRWIERGVLSGAKGSVRGVEFGVPDSPMGLRVASIATDSTLRVYTSLDPSLSDWSLSHEVHVPSLSGGPGASSDDAETQSLQQSSLQQPGSTSSAAGGGGGGASSGAGGSGAGNNTNGSGQNQSQSQSAVQEAATGGWGLSWCKDKHAEKDRGGVMAVISGTNPSVKIITLDPLPSLLLSLTPPSNASPLTSVSWAPSCGRAHYHVATGARDGTVRIWKLTPPDLYEEDLAGGAGYGNGNGYAYASGTSGRNGNGHGNASDQGAGAGGEWKGEQVAEFAKGARIGMVEWNATGTVLTASDDDGVVRMYKSTYDKSWKLSGKITAEEPSDD